MSVATTICVVGALISVGANFWSRHGREDRDAIDRMYRSGTAFAISMFGVGICVGAILVEWL